MSLEYRQRGELFEFDYLKCLRTDYFHNRCENCFDVCPVDAFFFDRGKLRIDTSKCTNCTVCIGVCPTEALSVEFFDPNEYVLKQSQDKIILSCKKDIPCLSVFDSEHYISMLLKSKELICDLSRCAECELNSNNKVLQSIKERIDEADSFVENLGFDKRVKEEEYQDNRRAFFKTLFSKGKGLIESKRVDYSKIDRVPKKITILKGILKPLTKDLKNKKISITYSFLSQKRIEDSCNNCGECIQFCPTGALFSAKDATAIWFMSGKCISCGICSEVCEPKSIVNEDSIDIVKWAFDRGEELIEHTIEICSECNTPFSYKGGELICDRCKKFVDEFSDIFKIASEFDQNQ